MSEHDPNESIAGALGALVRTALEGQTVDDATSRAQVLLRARPGPHAAGSLRRAWFALPAFAAACALLFWALTPGKLHYRVSGASQASSYVSAPKEHSVVVEFSDQTRVELGQSSQLRVEETSPHGAHLSLERGTAVVHVVHRERADWTFAAGPFDVHVIGTRFDLSWDPGPQVFELTLREGSVEIQSPLSAAPVVLRAGETFRGDLTLRTLSTAEVHAQRASAEPAVAPTPTPGPAPSEAIEAPLPDPTPSSVPAPRASSATAPALRSWPKLVAAGEFETLLRQANERGLPSCLRGCSAADLSALADAARYAGQGQIAEQSLLALRDRFVREPAGRSAAFLLGRLRESQGAASDASGWYGRYLSETPNGAYAAEALAGKMRSVLKLSGPALARPIAQEYLDRYPDGVHAGTARAILGPG